MAQKKMLPLKARSFLLVSPIAGCGEHERITQLLDGASATTLSFIHMLQIALQNPTASSLCVANEPVVFTDVEVLALPAVSASTRLVLVNMLRHCSASTLIGTWAGLAQPPEDVVRVFDSVETLHVPSQEQRAAKLVALGETPVRALHIAECTPGASLTRLERMHMLGLPFPERSAVADGAEEWNGIVGYDDVKHALTRVVTWRLERQAELARMGVEPVSGILLHGPSGCGKTQLALSFAHDPRVNFVQLKASDVFSKWFGESERLLRDAFAQARAKSPCVLFLDQVDLLAPKRALDGQGGNGVGSRILSTLLNELDGLDVRRDGLVVLGATSRLDAMDDAALRPGRLGYQIHVGLPSRVDAEALLHRLCAKAGAPSLNLAGVQLEGQSGAALCHMVNEACWRALRRSASALAREDFGLPAPAHLPEDDDESL